MKAYLPLKNYGFIFVAIMGISTWLAACTRLDVFEKNTVIPNNQWSFALQPSVDFVIADTTASYNVFIVLRHTDAYRYHNLWLNVGTQAPGDKTRFNTFELVLGTDATGWQGTGMDDIWEVRKLITNGPVRFNKAGNYRFTLAQIMRENPLPNIMSVGIRIEKAR
ncbi:gliding motility lipoprotein GldH [Ferruginibacter sp.]|uniref:gliding motility lipoprotein GldH n=1 Tax=Ferruginibacter sp. TaxID=1940288 RepID=UPI002657F7E3|nr:gliding motility lipoprotein GldH [Ferruginibacter sp.]